MSTQLLNQINWLLIQDKKAKALNNRDLNLLAELFEAEDVVLHFVETFRKGKVEQ